MPKPLNLPTGSVRAILSILVVLTGCVLAVIGQITGHPIQESFVGLLGTVVGYYVGARSSKEAPNA